MRSLSSCRSVHGDFLVALLRQLLETHRERKQHQRPLKVILMSATLDANMFSLYFGGCPGRCGQAVHQVWASISEHLSFKYDIAKSSAVVTAEGRTFPVEQFFLEDAYAVTGYRCGWSWGTGMAGHASSAPPRQGEHLLSPPPLLTTLPKGWPPTLQQRCEGAVGVADGRPRRR